MSDTVAGLVTADEIRSKIAKIGEDNITRDADYPWFSIDKLALEAVVVDGKRVVRFVPGQTLECLDRRHVEGGRQCGVVLRPISRHGKLEEGVLSGHSAISHGYVRKSQREASSSSSSSKVTSSKSSSLLPPPSTINKPIEQVDAPYTDLTMTELRSHMQSLLVTSASADGFSLHKLSTGHLVRSIYKLFGLGEPPDEETIRRELVGEAFLAALQGCRALLYKRPYLSEIDMWQLCKRFRPIHIAFLKTMYPTSSGTVVAVLFLFMRLIPMYWLTLRDCRRFPVA